MGKNVRIKQILYGIVAGAVLVALWCMSANGKSKEKETYSIVCFGDSILGQVRDEYGVVGLLEKKVQKSVFNGAFGGSHMSRINSAGELANMQDCLSMVALAEAITYDDFGPQQCATFRGFGTEYFEEVIDRLAQMDLEKSEILLIEHGTNDYNYGVPLVNEKDPYDQYTFTGALRRTLTLLKDKYPQLRIILVTPTYCWFPQWGYTCETYKPSGATLLDYIEAEKQIAEEFEVEVIDNYHLFSAAGGDYLHYTVDGLHPNNLGMEVIADSIFQYLQGNP